MLIEHTKSVLVVGNSEVRVMQCYFLNWFLSLLDGHAQKAFKKQHCMNTTSPKYLNYRPLLCVSIYLSIFNYYWKKMVILSRHFSLFNVILNLDINNWFNNILLSLNNFLTGGTAATGGTGAAG